MCTNLHGAEKWRLKVKVTAQGHDGWVFQGYEQVHFHCNLPSSVTTLSRCGHDLLLFTGSKNTAAFVYCANIVFLYSCLYNISEWACRKYLRGPLHRDRLSYIFKYLQVYPWRWKNENTWSMLCVKQQYLANNISTTENIKIPHKRRCGYMTESLNSIKTLHWHITFER